MSDTDPLILSLYELNLVIKHLNGISQDLSSYNKDLKLKIDEEIKLLHIIEQRLVKIR